MLRRLRMMLHGFSLEDARLTSSKAWLSSPQWRRCRWDALEKSDGRCEMCARNKHQLEPGEYLNVDHIKPRTTHPWLALDVNNLQVLCGECNMGKGNRSRDCRK